MTGKVLNRPLIRSVVFAAAIIGTIQAAIWVSLSLISILLYHSVIEIDSNLALHNYLRILYNIFLDAENTNEEIIVNTEVFNIFMYLYMVSSFVWLLISLYLMWAMKRNKWRSNSVVIGLWSGITILISVLDIVVISLVVADYITIQDLFSGQIIPTIPELPTTTPTINTESTLASTFPTETTTETTLESTSTQETTTITIPDGLAGFTRSLSEFIAIDTNIFQDSGDDPVWRQLVNTSYIIVMTLAARGYILWIINVIFASILIKFAIDISKQKTPSLLPMMDGYSTGNRPWSNNLYEQTDIGNGYSNGGFTDDNDRSAFPRSDSFVTAEPDIMNQNPLSNGRNPYAQQIEKLRPISDNPNIVSPKLAKIGKQNGRRTPPRNVPPPNIPHSNSPQIPDPDYTPPGSPLKPKSVLRPRSNYVL